MRLLSIVQRWFKLGDAATPAGRALLAEQFRILTAQVPVLYGVLVISTVSIAYVLPPSLPWWVRFGVPAALLVISAIRMIHWIRLKAVAPAPEETIRLLSRTRVLAVAINAGFSVWALALFEVIDAYSRAPVSLLVFMSSVGSAYCLASFPSAARLTLLLSALPISLRLLFSGDALLVCIGLNLCVLLLLLVRMMNINYRDLVKLVASRAKIFAERERAKAARGNAQSEQVKASEIAARFDTALNNMSQGLCFFDGAQRLIVCNRRYIDMYDLPPESVRSGITLREIVALRHEAGSFPDMTEEAYLAWRNNVAVSSVANDSIVRLKNGRVFEIHHRPMPDGGWVATHDDITESYHAKQALTEAKADAERAEQAARKAHATLVDAIDAIPEGIAVFDAEDRLVLWNRQCSVIFEGTDDFLTRGVRFEDSLRIGLKRGLYPEANGREEEWLRERMAQHALPQNSFEQCLSGDRWLRVEERKTSDGGSIGVRIDITDLKRREASFRLLFEENPLPMWVVDVSTLEFLAINAAACRHYGYTREQFLSMTVANLRMPEEREKVRGEFQRHKGVVTGGQTTRCHLTADGRVIEVAIESRPLRYDGRDASVAVAFDMTERNCAERRIIHLARHDALTDLPNRSALDDHFARALEAAHARGGRLAVMCLDLDRFKEINDLCGHSMGDAALREVSRRLLAAAGDAFLARIGGDEFVAIAELRTPHASVEALAQRFQDALEADVEVDGHAFDLGLSVGIAVFPQDGVEATTLVGNADAALYRAKKDGRGAIRFFTAAMDRQLRDRRALERDLRTAIENGEFALAYQPQQRSDGEIIGFEALARWHHPLRGSIPPGEFIPIAEESGLIVEIGEWVLREACREAASWQEPLQVAVNVSAVQFRRGNLQNVVHAILLETGLPATRLELEITEGVLIENVARAAAILRSLKALGVRIALDDFGTGYSSLSYLQSFPLDRIKIDRTFVTSLGRSDRSLAIVRAVIGLAHGLGLPVLAEGVETEGQRTTLTCEGCDELQGYLIGYPEPIEAYADVVGGARVAARLAVGAM